MTPVARMAQGRIALTETEARGTRIGAIIPRLQATTEAMANGDRGEPSLRATLAKTPVMSPHAPSAKTLGMILVTAVERQAPALPIGRVIPGESNGGRIGAARLAIAAGDR